MEVTMSASTSPITRTTFACQPDKESSNYWTEVLLLSILRSILRSILLYLVQYTVAQGRDLRACSKTTEIHPRAGLTEYT